MKCDYRDCIERASVRLVYDAIDRNHAWNACRLHADRFYARVLEHVTADVNWWSHWPTPIKRTERRSDEV